MSHPSDIRPLLSLQDKGVRIQAPGVGAVTISDIGMAGFLLAYPTAWASLHMLDTQQLVDVCACDLTPLKAVTIKQLMAAALIREFAEPREGQLAPASELPGPIMSDARDALSRATGVSDPIRLGTMLAVMFNRPQARMRRGIDALQQRDAR
ncbi:MAG: hypothetical protein ACYDD1_15270 [Caulobacteraceae bacterium]